MNRERASFGTLSMKTLDHVTVSEGGTITIPCLYDSQYKRNSKYWCKGYTWAFCKILARANSTKKWAVTDYPADNIFTVKLDNPTSSDSGNYWCAVEIDANPDDKNHLYVTVKKVPDVSVVSSSVSGREAGDISVQCLYSSGYQYKTKQWCRYKDERCYTVGRTDTSQSSSVQISDDDGRRSFTVLMTGLRLTDSGWYFCSVGDLQAPVELHVHNNAQYKNTSECDESISGLFPNQTGSNDTMDSSFPLEDSSDRMDWFLLLYISVSLLLLLMLVIFIWRLIQKHRAWSKPGPDICSVAEDPVTVAYDTVVFKKAEDREQNQGRRSEQVEVIYSTPQLHY
ncbi:polymeric immunoglobulin receptor-like 4.2 isoform X2 [Puntigrus tetrazona]|uniref:polymeric immunoglobulin receptor-like 4.2 isoform X2 n=1 Tax=Puntigrus tetrazona TaxID=1606681 RepID=UPI001C8A1D91|nr:polymeric immunoglobulin receptor-like 4.2 isoform X2 [Puntigrus tetrazona]